MTPEQRNLVDIRAAQFWIEQAFAAFESLPPTARPLLKASCALERVRVRLDDPELPPLSPHEIQTPQA